MSINDDKIKALSEENVEKLLVREVFRARVNDIIYEYVGKVDFLKVVREYAGMEIESRIFKSWKYWLTLIITAIITSSIGVIIAVIFKN